MDKRYSKPSGPLFEIKEDFFTKNKELLEEALKVNKSYIEQEPRESCKNCNQGLEQVDLQSFGIPYSICTECGHLNGLHKDSSEFLDNLYSADDGDNYKESYLSGYDSRVENIYIPKVSFLIDVLDRDFTVRDVGCGGGHFVKACEENGIHAIGIDPNKSLIELGQKKLDVNHIQQCDPSEFEGFIRGADDVVSMIGVLEHLQRPDKALEAFNESNAKYLYISVPLFSLSVFIEHAFDNVFPRHLRGPHTHLYTPESLEYMANKYNLKTVGQWWFGSDIMDLYRSLLINSDGSNRARAKLGELLGDNIDKLQAVLDESQSCSEVHLIFKKK